MCFIVDKAICKDKNEFTIEGDISYIIKRNKTLVRLDNPLSINLMLIPVFGVGIWGIILPLQCVCKLRVTWL